MHARTKLALAITLSLIAGTLQAAEPWQRADSKILGNNADQTVRRSSRAYSYSPPTTTAPAAAAPATRAAVAPTTAVRPQMAQAPLAAQAPAARQVQSVAPRTQPGAVVTAPPANVAPTNRATNQPATNYVQPQTRGYRSYSYQPAQPSYGYRNNYSTRTRRVPFYMRADSKVLGREGY
ncbi:MAG TPA: hypothetical protein VG433_13700 [Pirellulales bacterium]|jgi:hypothetical protein|nr:hypothetical protein [Pirellulales bacterium]